MNRFFFFWVFLNGIEHRRDITVVQWHGSHFKFGKVGLGTRLTRRHKQRFLSTKGRANRSKNGIAELCWRFGGQWQWVCSVEWRNTLWIVDENVPDAAAFGHHTYDAMANHLNIEGWVYLYYYTIRYVHTVEALWVRQSYSSSVEIGSSATTWRIPSSSNPADIHINFKTMCKVCAHNSR